MNAKIVQLVNTKSKQVDGGVVRAVSPNILQPLLLQVTLSVCRVLSMRHHQMQANSGVIALVILDILAQLIQGVSDALLDQSTIMRVDVHNVLPVHIGSITK